MIRVFVFATVRVRVWAGINKFDKLHWKNGIHTKSRYHVYRACTWLHHTAVRCCVAIKLKTRFNRCNTTDNRFRFISSKQKHTRQQLTRSTNCFFSFTSEPRDCKRCRKRVQINTQQTNRQTNSITGIPEKWNQSYPEENRIEIQKDRCVLLNSAKVLVFILKKRFLNEIDHV